MSTRSKHIYEFGPFRLIPEERQLLRDDDPVPIPPKSFDLLVALLESRGHLIEKAELMKRLWPDSFVEEGNLSVNMSAVRRVLGEGPNDHQYVETVPRHGYRFVADVKEQWGQDAQVTVASSPRAITFRRWPLMLLLSLAVIAFAAAFASRALRQRATARVNPNQIQSLAVLPLENLSGDSSQEYFADGMTEALIANLSKISAIRIMSRSSVIQYKSVRKPPSDIGRELNVDALLTGSVARVGDRVRITAQLVEPATNRNLWAESYERDVSDVIALQNEVARDIVGEIRLKLRQQQPLAESTARRVNAEAYDQYLRGHFYLNHQTKDDNKSAIDALERAVALDATFADAYAELAQAYVWKLFLFAPDDKQSAERAFVATEKALALDPNSGEAHLARGRLLWTPANHFPHERAILEYRRALELDPTLDEARNQLALVYCHIGAFDQALQQAKEAIAANPNNNLAQLRIGQTLNFEGKYDDALNVLRGIPPEANPALVGHQMAWALFNLGRRHEASAMLDKLLKDYPQDTGGVFTSIQAVLAASSGEPRVAEAKIKSAVERGKGYGHFHHTAYQIACAYALMNKPEPAIRWLQAAADDGFPCFPLFEKDRNLDRIRNDSRFPALLVKLKQQWDEYQKIL
jgi:TolB-like protein/DNA-binding winged helix-turn-helix (wHTH) protein/lipopolysaccharide biosynthesis regulator YciM